MAQVTGTWGLFQYKDVVLPVICQYKDSHYKDKRVAWPYYLYNGNTIPGKTVFILRQGLEILAYGRQEPTSVTLVGDDMVMQGARSSAAKLLC